MSRIHRALEKADREGLLTWTKGGGDTSVAVPETPAPAVAPPAPIRSSGPRPAAWAPPVEEVQWQPSAEDVPQFHLSPTFVAATAPSSSAAEHYRLLRARLERQEKGRRKQLVLITSAQSGDGKTTTSANLALTMAQEYGQRVVLVEGDLRRPTLADQFGLEPGPGLVDVLVGAVSLEAALVHLPEHGLHVLPGGLPTPRSAGLVASAAMRRVIDSLRGRFDRIVLDAPPSTIADTHELVRVADGVLFVVRAGVTPRESIEKALEEMDTEKVLGIVLNDSDTAGEQNGYSYADAPRDAARG
jgi:capsular exopolysaccharide synthesis family protein